MKNALSLGIAVSLFCSSVVFADIKAPDQGTVQITVLDENGAVVAEAPVYIYGARRSQFVGGADVPGSTTFSMKEGSYKISSALVKRSGDYVDRYLSNEAQVNVVAGDNVSVILTLKPVKMPGQQPVSYAQLHVAQVPGNLYQN